MAKATGMFDRFIKDTNHINAIESKYLGDKKMLEDRLTKLRVRGDRDVSRWLNEIEGDFRRLMTYAYLTTKENCEKEVLVNATERGIGKLAIRSTKKKLG